MNTERTVAITNSSDWQVYKTYNVDTQVLPAGRWTLDVTFISARGQYTGNVENLSITLKQEVDAIRPIIAKPGKAPAIYTIDGLQVGNDAGHLPSGIYIIDGKKSIVK